MIYESGTCLQVPLFYVLHSLGLAEGREQEAEFRNGLSAHDTLSEGRLGFLLLFLTLYVVAILHVSNPIGIGRLSR